MTHARTSTLPAVSPVQVAIANHRAAYDAFQVAPEGDEAMFAESTYNETSMALVAVICTTPADTLTLFRYLVWWLQDEAEYAAGHEPAYSIAMARARDLSLLLASMTRPASLPLAMPSGRIAARIPRRAVLCRSLISAPASPSMPLPMRISPAPSWTGRPSPPSGPTPPTFVPCASWSWPARR